MQCLIEMAKYLLDTNILIYYFRGQFNVEKQIQRIGWENCYVSEISIAEIKYGNEISKQRGFKISPKFDLIIKNLHALPISNVIDMYAEEKARLRQNGTPIHDDFDLLIACTSVVNGMIMVTENLKDFKNIKGISIENWIVRD